MTGFNISNFYLKVKKIIIIKKKLFVISPSSLHLCDILRTDDEAAIALACLAGRSREQVIF